ncbi:1-acyl-sn-glycerol-3-phosphate acyltransferase [candidate division KSB1 bacterium]|nr:1-acyl-sn-glycerol-3-phosphate acyltransferase [candidate division KSB1 bacterium]
MKNPNQASQPSLSEKIISAGVWAIGLLNFIILIPFATLLMIIFKPNVYDNTVKFLCRLFIRSLFIKVVPQGYENFNPGKTYIFMSNHVNIFDVFILNGFIPNFVRGVELEDHFRWFVYGAAIRRFGNIPISHKNPRQALVSLNKAEEALKSGTSIIILPEGGRTLDGNFKPFKRGAFRLAKNAGFDIVPMVLKDAYRVKRKGNNLIRPGTVYCRFGEVIPREVIDRMTPDELRETIRDAMQGLLERRVFAH